MTNSESTLAAPSAVAQPDDFWAEAELLGRALMGQLEYFEALGVEGFPPSVLPPAPARPAPGKPSQATPPEAVSKRPPRPVSAPGRSEEPAGPEIWAPSAASLSDLAELTGRCQGCPLAATRIVPPVWGRGGPAPMIVAVGPTPAICDEEPRKILSGMMENVLGLTSEQYYVTTLAKCLPPDGEAPPPAADHNCRPILLKELELLKPRIVLALGRMPGQRLSGSRDHLALMRPKTHSVKGLPGPWLRVTYGLEDLAASQELKLEAWKDLQKIKMALKKM